MSVLRHVLIGSLQLVEEDKVRGTRRTHPQSGARCLSTKMYSEVPGSIILSSPPGAIEVSLLFVIINMFILLTDFHMLFNTYWENLSTHLVNYFDHVNNLYACLKIFFIVGGKFVAD